MAEEVKELDITDFVELVNGRVAGLRLAFNLFISHSQTAKDIRSYIRDLEQAEVTIIRGMEKGEFQFASEGYPNGTLSELKNLIESLTDSAQRLEEMQELLERGIEGVEGEL